jgi:hypothetical protein
MQFDKPTRRRPYIGNYEMQRKNSVFNGNVQKQQDINIYIYLYLFIYIYVWVWLSGLSIGTKFMIYIYM